MVETKPVKIPRWNDTGGNRTEPLEAEKDAGWALNDQPPSSYFNWLQHYTGSWLKWLDERMNDGTLTRDFVLQGAVASSGRGSDITVQGTSAVTSSNRGGNVAITAGNGLSQNGGDIQITSGDATTSGTGGALTITSGDGVSVGGNATLQGGQGNAGGTFNIWAGAGTVSNGGQVSISGGVGEINGGITAIYGGDGNTGAGGGADLIGGEGYGSSGGRCRLKAGDGVTLGGTASLDGGDGNTGGPLTLSSGSGASGPGGDITMTAGNGSTVGGSLDIDAGTGASGGGGDIAVTAGDGTSAGGLLDLDAGSATTSGFGGDVRINAGAGIGSEGGDCNLTGGNSDVDGGDVTIQGGDCTSSGGGGKVFVQGGIGVSAEGGDVSINGGVSNGADGGDVTIESGHAVGTNLNAGEIQVRTGDATGSGFGNVRIRVSEGGASGATPRSAQDYVECSGQAASKNVQVKRYLTVDNSVDSTRGEMRIFSKAEPSAPSVGDVYHDSTTGQLAFHNGARYHNLNPRVHNMIHGGVWAENTWGTPVTWAAMEERLYGGALNNNPHRFVIPANTLRPGSTVRVTAGFEQDIGAGNYNSVYVTIGSVGAGPPYISPTGIQIAGGARTTLAWRRAAMWGEMTFYNIGANPDVGYCGTSSWGLATSPTAGAEANFVFTASTLDTTVPIDVFPMIIQESGALFTYCMYFIVEIF